MLKITCMQYIGIGVFLRNLVNEIGSHSCRGRNAEISTSKLEKQKNWQFQSKTKAWEPKELMVHIYFQ